jgi:FixJ family two-component response regulator
LGKSHQPLQRRRRRHPSRGQRLSRRELSSTADKQVGFELGISEITVKAHRGRVMRKMEAGSLADLVNVATKLRLAPGLEC